MKSTLAVAKLNFQTSKLTYLITGIALLSSLISQGIQTVIGIYTNAPAPINAEDMNTQTGIGNYFYLLIMLMACLIPALNFRKFMNLNVKKSTYLKGTALTYIIIAPIISALNLICYYTIEKLIAIPANLSSVNLIDVFGWINNGVLIAFIQQIAFLLMLAAFIHTLTTMQTFWYGWVTAFVLCAIISVFTPIAPLRQVLISFFYLLLFNTNAAMQIGLNLILAVAFYLISIIPVKQKTI